MGNKTKEIGKEKKKRARKPTEIVKTKKTSPNFGFCACVKNKKAA